MDAKECFQKHKCKLKHDFEKNTTRHCLIVPHSLLKMSSTSYVTTNDCFSVCRVFSKEDVEKCKQKDLLEQTMSEMIGEFPALHQTIVAERDIYLTHTLRQATRCVEPPHNAQSAYSTGD